MTSSLINYQESIIPCAAFSLPARCSMPKAMLSLQECHSLAILDIGKRLPSSQKMSLKVLSLLFTPVVAFHLGHLILCTYF